MGQNSAIMTDELPVDELEAMAEENVGEAVRQTRLYYGKTLADVEKALHIRSSQISAIERGDIAQLPGQAYVVGFVRSYAEYLGLDSAKVIELFKAQYMRDPVETVLSFPVPASETKTPAFWLLVLSLILTFLFFLALYLFNKPDQSSTLEIRDIPKDIKAHVTQDILPDPLASDLQNIAPENMGPYNVTDHNMVVENMKEDEGQKTGTILSMIGDSWVEIKNSDGDILVSSILKKGDQYFLPDNPGFSMSLGNAANVEIILNGRPLKPLGKEGDVRRDIPLNTTYLRTLAFEEAKKPIIPAE